MVDISMLVPISAVLFLMLRWEEVAWRRFLPAGLVLGILGGALNGYLTSTLQAGQPAVGSMVLMGALASAVAVSGLHLAQQARLPGLWASSHVSGRLMGVGIVVIIAACLGWVQQYIWHAGGQIADVPAWFEQIQALPNSRVIVHVAAVQAGLLEETWFRLYAISALSILISALFGRPHRVSTIAAVIMSAMAFGAVAGHVFLPGLVVGMILGACYLRYGLIPLIVGHVIGGLLLFPSIIT